MKDGERARAMCVLAAIELNMSEAMAIEGWWKTIAPEDQAVWRRFQAWVRVLQHRAQNSLPEELKPS